MITKYRPPGTVGRWAYIVLPFALLAAVALGIGYEWATSHASNGRLYLKLILGSTFLTLFLLTYGTAAIGRIRSRTIGVIVGAVLGIVVVGAAWGTLYQVDPAGVKGGRDLAEFATHRYEQGAPDRMSSPRSPRMIKGPALAAAWLVEAVALVAAGVVGGWACTGRPFCAECDTEAKDQQLCFPRHRVSDRQIVLARTSTIVEEIIDADVRDGESRRSLRYTLCVCRCGKLHHLGIAKGKRDRKTGKVKEWKELRECVLDEADAALFSAIASAGTIDPLSPSASTSS
jgi:hypothetical protein